MTKRLTVVYEVIDDYQVARITGTGELEVVRYESMDVMQELGKVTARLAEAQEAARWLWPKVSDEAYDAAWAKWPWLDSEAAKGGEQL